MPVEQRHMIRTIKGSWWIDVWVHGKRYRKKSPDNSRTGALAFEYQFRRTAGRLQALPAEVQGLLEGEVNFAAFAQVWFVVYVKPRLELSTREGYVAVLRRSLVPHFGKLRLDHVDETAVDGFIQSEKARGASAKTINNALGILGRCLRMAKRWRLVDEVPEIQMLKVPPPEFDYLTAVESRQLLRAAEGTRWWLFILCALRTGMRASELFALRWESVDLETGTIHVRRGRFHGVEKAPKNNRIRHLPITEDLWRALQAVRRTDGYVFTGMGGDPLSWDVAYNGVRGVCDRAGLRRVGLHVLRHSFASQLAMEGVDLLPIQMLMGHSDIKVTTRYAHLPHAALRISVQNLVAAHARLGDWHQPGTSDDCATLPAIGDQRLESANGTTKTPAHEEQALVVPRRGFEGDFLANVSYSLRQIWAPETSQRIGSIPNE